MNVSRFPWSVIHPDPCTDDLGVWQRTWRHAVHQQRAIGGHGPWTSPPDLLTLIYDRITALHPTAPVRLAEVGCRPARPGEPASKAAWYLDLLATTALPRVTALLFLHSDKEHDWRITTSDLQPVRERLMRSLRGRCQSSRLAKGLRICRCQSCLRCASSS